MKFSWTLLCCLALAAALTACKSSAPASTEGDPEVEATTVADERAKPDIPAPPDVAAVPEDAQRSESGLAWKVLQEGEGKVHPKTWDTVSLSYTGWTPDGRMFGHNSKIRGKVEDLLPGWVEGVQLMLPGEKRRFWIPGKLTFGEHEGAAKPNDADERADRPRGMVVYDIELIELTRGPIPPRAVPEDVAEIPENAERSESGLAWRVLQEGKGKKHPTATSTVFIQYAGWTTDGKMFDTSIARGGVAAFALSQALPGWREGIPMMVVGEMRRFWIPENLGFAGGQGPSGMLVYDLQLVDFKD